MIDFLTFNKYREFARDLDTCSDAVVICDQIMIMGENYLKYNPTFYDLLLKAIEEIYPALENHFDEDTVENFELSDYGSYANPSLQCSVSFILYQIEKKEQKEAESLNENLKLIRKEGIDHSFTFNFSKQDTSNLLKALKENRYIDYDSLKEVAKIFNGNQLTDIKEKIKWTDTTAKKQPCHQGVFLLLSKEYMKADCFYPKSRIGLYELIKRCFCKANGDEFDSDELKQSDSRMNKKRKNKKLSSRDEILIMLIRAV